MLFEATFALLVLSSYVSCQPLPPLQGGEPPRCYCYEEPDDYVTVTSPPIGPGGSSTTTTIVIPILGSVQNKLHFDQYHFPSTKYRSSFEHSFLPTFGRLIITQEELKRRNAPPQFTQTLETIQKTITERMELGKNVKDERGFRTWNFQLSNDLNEALGKLSNLPSGQGAANYRDLTEALELQFLTTLNFLTYSMDSVQCIYKAEAN